MNVDLSAKSRLIPFSDTAGMLSLNDLYVEERDACENYRVILSVNPICSNVLYNAITEPVYKEGSYSAINIAVETVMKDNTDIFPEGTMNQSGDTNGNRIVDQIGAVRDTEYSHERIGNFKYHCGYDFFNNHLLRTNEFEHVKMEESIIPKNKVEFNTIFDFAIDHSGKTVTRVIGESEGPVVGSDLVRENIRMYQLDNMRSMNTAFYDEFRELNGWYGFYNTGYINIPNGKLNGTDISLNRILNNEVPCGFVDLYPDRSLYSFIPKVNRYKKRLERNWDCTIVYPYKSDYETFGKINKNLANAVRVINTQIVYNNVGDELIEMHSLLRHTLNPGDEIRLFYRDSQGESDFDEMDWESYLATNGAEVRRYTVPVKVISVGDKKGNDKEHYFTIKMSDVDIICGVMDTEGAKKYPGIKDTTGNVTGPIFFFYKKIENGVDDRYYFRKFKQLVNYEYVMILPDEVSSEEYAKLVSGATRVIHEPTVINENSPKIIRLGNDIFVRVSRPLTYTQNKIAFGENIYGDRVAQVIFNDDICVTGLKDNLGRPLSTVFFANVKTNRGHKEWYEDNIFSADCIEYSHCFGDVTSGLDLPSDKESTEYNVRKLYNVFLENPDFDRNYAEGLSLILSDAPTGNYSGTPTPLESAITVDSFDEFFGDIVEFSKIDFIETPIEKVYHRFNTAQRECLTNSKYFDINYDNLVGDLFDVEEVRE